MYTTQDNWHCLDIRRKYTSKGLIDGDAKEYTEKQSEEELRKISQLFPQPRVTLNEFASRAANKVFDVYYKQSMLHKGVRKKIIQGDWTCSYMFVWPEKIKFESTALSKRQAADKAATHALHWLYANRRIDKRGYPVYEEHPELTQSALEQHLEATISDKTIERIKRIWNDYESAIKPIYDKTFSEATKKAVDTPALMRDSSLDAEDELIEEDESFEHEELSDTKTRVHPVYGRSVQPPTDIALQRRDKVLKNTFKMYDEERLPLPIDEYTDQITSALEKSRALIIVGAAGCGKSTRAPAAILKACGSSAAIVVSEPRRVAAIGLAERVASELGEEAGETVGYQVRLQSRPPRPNCGSILYCTSGTLLRKLRDNPGLQGCSHAIVDEVHERDVNTDVMLLLLRRALADNAHLKVIVMSATLDIDVFTRYFDSCPIVEVPGRTFPVQIHHLEDIKEKYGLTLTKTFENCTKQDSKPTVVCQEVVQLIKAVDENEREGAILVFLPGWFEIKTTKQLLEQQLSESTHMVLPVHSRLSTSDQSKMFSKPPPGIRKIVLASNIAETSITIPDVVYVIDAGVHKENKTKEGTGTSSLESVWVSKAGAKQRAGRAGRVQSGHCFKLYTKDRESQFSSHTTPEILRVPLDQTVLDCKVYSPDSKAQEFLSQLPQPPSDKAIRYAVDELIDLGALTPSQQLTRTGAFLSAIPLRPRLARCLLLSTIIGNVAAAANLLAHCSAELPLVSNTDNIEQFRELKRKYSKTSDHSALYGIQKDFERAIGPNKDEWCERNGLRKDRLRYIRSLSHLHIEQLLGSGFIEPNPDPDELTRFSNDDPLIAAILLAGSNSLITTRKSLKTKGKLTTTVGLHTTTGHRAHIGTESVNYAINKRCNTKQLIAYYGGQLSKERRALVAYKTSLIPPHTALIFSDGDVVCSEDTEDPSISIINLRKHRLSIRVPSSQAEHILKAREMLWKTFQYYINRDYSTLEYDDMVAVSRFKVKAGEDYRKIDRRRIRGAWD
ncbi:hypothetical protein ACJJTC_007373 [Scirpophaga incertulas]